MLLGGCVSAKAPVQVPVDLTERKCPAVPEFVKEARAVKVERPKPDAKTDDGRPALKPATHRRHITDLEAAIQTKDAAIDEVSAQYDWCRSAG